MSYRTKAVDEAIGELVADLAEALSYAGRAGRNPEYVRGLKAAGRLAVRYFEGGVPAWAAAYADEFKDQ